MHKQRNPLWYASDGYFTRRNLPVPPDGDRSRFLKGALGNSVLYLDKDTPVHDGLPWSEEVGGVQVDQQTIETLYSTLDVGALVLVK